jgi:hypothetical protein
MNSKVYVVILNWNGWQDTLACLDSVFANAYRQYTVIVCDNGSEDGSLEHIKQWAEENLVTRRYVKPIACVEYTREQAECGGLSGEEPSLVLIQTGSNLGFAGGNNVALRYALSRDKFAYVWLLNNDTIVTENALAHLVKRMNEKPGVGLCGSTLLYYDRPNLVQALGGAVYNKWLGMPRHIGANQLFREDIVYDNRTVEGKMQYVVGASMFVSKSFLLDIGLLNEEYFLYFEELDWAVRAKGRYSLGYAANSIVYHKEGSSVGSSHNGQERSWLSDYYGIRNRLLFTRKYYPEALVTVYIGLVATVVNRIRRRQYDRVKMIWQIVKSLFTGRSGGKL